MLITSANLVKNINPNLSIRAFRIDELARKEPLIVRKGRLNMIQRCVEHSLFTSWLTAAFDSFTIQYACFYADMIGLTPFCVFYFILFYFIWGIERILRSHRPGVLI